MKVIILAGGGGTRLFPLSRTCFPKQFMKIDAERSLLVQTLERFRQLADPDEMIIVTNREYLHHVRSELAVCNLNGVHVLLEPQGRNTAPAIALAASYCRDELGCSSDEVMLVAPSDHIIRDNELLVKAVRAAEVLAGQQQIVTFGIKPDKPETGYGYIESGEELQGGWRVRSFKEKPDLATAEQYLADGSYFWNSGMFAFTLSCIIDELKRHQPQIAKLMEMGYQKTVERFDEMPSISLDYAVAEKSQRIAVVPLQAYWNDIGSWDAIYEVLDKDENGNAVQGDCLTLDCSNMLMLGGSRLIAGIGLEDVLVVETDDVIVVAKKGESQKVKELVGELRRRGRREADEHTTMYRPWGHYQVLGEGPGYKMKKISVKPGASLSLQLHYHRTEHWIVIGGTAKVTLADEIRMVHENESVFIPMSTRHRLENPGRIPLEIIEVQNGRYLEEDDIIRFDDEYGRS